MDSENQTAGNGGEADSSPADGASAARWKLILTGLCVLGVGLLAAVLVLQVNEYRFYDAAPGVWPQQGGNAAFVPLPAPAPLPSAAPVMPVAPLAPLVAATAVEPLSAANTSATAEAQSPAAVTPPSASVVSSEVVAVAAESVSDAAAPVSAAP